MFNCGNCTDKYNPQILFVIDCMKDGFNDKHKTKYHCHDFVEISIITSGQIHYLIDNEHHLIKKGQILIFNPGKYHQEIIDEDTKCSELHIGISNLYLHDTKKNYIETNDSSPILNLGKSEIDFLNCCAEISKEQKLGRVGYPYLLKALVMKLLVIIYREIHGEIHESNYYTCSFESREKHNIVNSIIEYMQENYMEDISLDKISKNMYLSPVYISKIFKEETGDSPINYLIKIRLLKAKELLRENSMPIKEVAQSVGYNDAYHFSKLFKKYYGLPPSRI